MSSRTPRCSTECARDRVTHRGSSRFARPAQSLTLAVLTLCFLFAPVLAQETLTLEQAVTQALQHNRLLQAEKLFSPE